MRSTLATLTLGSILALGATAATPAWADDPRVPLTGSEQGTIVPNAMPGPDAPHATGARPAHLTAPLDTRPGNSAQISNDPDNASPGRTAATGELQPHADVTSPRGLIPQSAEGPSRR